MQVVAKWIDIEYLKTLLDEQVAKALKLANESELTDNYNKGIIVGKIILLKELIMDDCPQCGDKKLKTLLVCDECFQG